MNERKTVFKQTSEQKYNFSKHTKSLANVNVADSMPHQHLKGSFCGVHLWGGHSSIPFSASLPFHALDYRVICPLRYRHGVVPTHSEILLFFFPYDAVETASTTEDSETRILLLGGMRGSVCQ